MSELNNIIKRIKVGAALSASDATILENEMNSLQHFKDSSTGLHCIDKNPKDVSKQWIEENSFQL